MKATFQKYDIVRLIRKFKNKPSEEYSCRIDWIEENEDSIRIGYSPCERNDSVQCGWGTGKIDNSEYGLKFLEIVGKYIPQHFYKPIHYMNSGYDPLM